MTLEGSSFSFAEALPLVPAEKFVFLGLWSWMKLGLTGHRCQLRTVLGSISSSEAVAISLKITHTLSSFCVYFLFFLK